MNPDVGSRCGECRLGLGVPDTRDPYCDHYQASIHKQEES